MFDLHFHAYVSMYYNNQVATSDQTGHRSVHTVLVFHFNRPGRKRDFTPLPWSHYFETMEDVEVENENGKDISFECCFCLSAKIYLGMINMLMW